MGALIAVGVLELVGLTYAGLVQRAAARRPLYGPPLPPPNLNR